MLSRRTPQNVLGSISQQQTSARPQPSSCLSTNILQLHNGTLPQGVNIKLTDDCYQNLQKAAQNGFDVLVHVNRKSITIEIKTHNATSLKFDCYFQRVSGNTIHALCKSNNTFNDVANIAIRAQVKPTEQTFQSSRQKAANLSKHLELESNKCRTQMLSAPITKPGERLSIKNKATVNRVGIPKSIPNPLRNGSSSIGSTTLTSSSSSSNLSLNNSNKLGGAQRGPKDYAALKQQVIHYIACGRFKTQDEIVDHIISTGLPPGIPPESAKRKIREIICEVAEVYVNPPKIALLPQYHREINIDWEYFSVEDRERVRQALSQTEITAGNNFAPMRHSRRGPFVAPKSKTRKDPATPAMTNSTTTSPDIASDASTCSTPSPVNQMQIDNDYHQISTSSKPEKRKLSSNDLSKLVTTTSMNSSLNNDIVPPPVKKRSIMNDSSSFPSSSKEVQPMTIDSTTTTTTTTKSIPKSSSQSDFQKFRSSPYLKPVSSPQIQQQQNGFKSKEKSEKLQNKEQRHRSKEFIPIDKNQLYNGFTKSKNEEKFVVNGSNISKKPDQSYSKTKITPSIQENVSIKSDEFKREKSKIATSITSTSESEKDVLCEKTKVLMEFADESVKKLKEKEKEKEKKKEKIKKDNEKIVAEEKVLDKRDKNVENITKLDVNNGISTVDKKKMKIEIKLEKQPKEKNEEKIEKQHRNHHHQKEKLIKDKKEIKKSDPATTPSRAMASTTNMTLKEDTFKDPSKIIIKEEVKEASKKEKKLDEKMKEKHSSNKKAASDKESSSLKADESGPSSETSKKEKKKDKEHKKEHRSSKTEGDVKIPTEKKVKTETTLPNSTKSNDIIAEKPKEKEKHKEKEKEKTKEKSSKIKEEAQEKSKMSAKDAATLASEKLLLKPAEKLSKPVIRETTKPPPKDFKPLNPEKLTPEDIKRIKIQDLLKLLSDPLKPSKSYEEKYPPIRTPADAEVYAKHETEYYELYEKAYNQLLTVQKDLSIYVERLNKSQTDQEKNKLEEKIRNYAARCLQDDNFRNQRRTVANMTKAIQVLRQRQDDYYGPEQNNP